MGIKLGLDLSVDALYAKDKVHEFIDVFEPIITSTLDEYLEHAQTDYNSYAYDAINFYNTIALRGGKRIRGALSYYTYKMLGGTNEDVGMQLATAIEMLHAYWLVVDDFTDKSNLRRGGPTAHILARDYFSNAKYVRNDPEHIGNAIVVTAGIVQGHRVQELILNLDVPDSLKIEAAKNLDGKVVTTGYGQITDIFNALMPSVIEQDVLDMLKWKTGVYTFENPIHMGAIIAEGSKSDMALLSKYAIPTGIAFQIHDDIIGMFGNSEETGKSDKDDLMEGKMTLLIQHALTHTTAGQLELLNKHLGNRHVTDSEHEEIKELLIECGSYDYSTTMARKLVADGKKFLKETPTNWNPDGIKFLEGVADYVIQRAS